MPGGEVGPILIAECGVSWDTLDEARAMIECAKGAGFTLAKFQYYNEAVIKRTADESLREKLRARKLVGGQVAALYRHGKKCGIPVFFTVMFPEGIETILAIGVDYLKVRHADAENIELWKEISEQEYHGTIFYSTSNARASFAANRIPLYCVPKYPALCEDYDPVYHEAPLARRIGVSLHAPHRGAFLRAWYEGAVAIETHVRMDAHEDVLDREVAIPFSQATEWIAEGREPEEMEEIPDADAGLGGQLHHEPGILEPTHADYRGLKKKKWDLFKKLRRRRDRGGSVAGT